MGGLLVIVAFERRGGLVGGCGRLGFAFGSFGERWKGRTLNLPFWRLLFCCRCEEVRGVVLIFGEGRSVYRAEAIVVTGVVLCLAVTRDSCLICCYAEITGIYVN